MLIGYYEATYVNHDDTIELNRIIVQFLMEYELIGYCQGVYVNHGDTT